MRTWLLLAVAIVTEVAGTLALRAAVDRPPWYVVVVVSYVVAFGLVGLVVSRGAPIGVVYGIWSASGVALTAVLAWALFDDPLTWVMGLGIVAVVAGVLLVETGSRHDEDAAGERAGGR